MSLDPNQTVWQRLRIALDTADGACVDAGERGLTAQQKDAITAALHPYVIAERHEARGNS